MFYFLILGLVGIAGILSGAKITVNGSKSVAKKLGISEFFIGLTILSIGTSLPEIFTHIVSALRILREPANILTISGIAVGTNIGSNIIQITLIAGIAGLVSTIHATKRFMRQDYVFMLMGILILWFFCLDSMVTRLEAVVLIILYLLYLVRLGSQENLKDKMKNHNHASYSWDIFKMVAGLFLLVACAKLTLDSAVFFADYFHIAGSLIGALIIGVATALPELTTAVTALIKKSSGLSLGTLVGSNITNPLLALGIGAAISTYKIDDSILWYYIPFWFVASLVAFFFLWRKLKLEKWEALILILAYPFFVIVKLFLEVAG